MIMLPSLKSVLVVGAVACIATANPISRHPIERSNGTTLANFTSSVYPADAHITMTKHLTLVIEHTPVDCSHRPLPTTSFAVPACEFSNGLSSTTSTRYYCEGSRVFPPWGELGERDPDEKEEDVGYDADEDDVDEDDEDDEDADEEDDEEDDEDDEDGDYLSDHSEPGFFAPVHFDRMNMDCTTSRMLGPPVLDFTNTTTVYTTTSTVSRLVGCGRCTAVKTVPYFSPGYPPQFPKYTTTVTAIQPTTTTLLNCEPQPTQDGVYAEREIVSVGGIPEPVRTHLTKEDHWPPLVTTYTDFPRGRDEVECAMYYNLFPSRLGSVRKIYTATKTTTAHKDCGVCALVWGTAAYPFEVGPLPTTKTMKGKTKITAMACRTPKGGR
ncbi:hypothetical protein TsFJ059_007798 [Trichoderma semiorbis]|uniref:Uncharacterized protein n=1 Tax=Trichoderma semiorbis TaxID=1491008 RepID=A0A9P8KSZ3_9HYPO|nr:hypothetical protein TsFJ059_007798 [Trichoderma semiorbis]